jgi:3-hydroxymyristoyl/3-hydroxydecanoyl-(acyl carrier protein) dehydratase
MMQQEIKKYVRADLEEDGSFSASFCFPESFAGFDGHFPEQPVLPGVCLIQSVLVGAELASGRTLKVVEIVLAKFVAVVQPDEQITATCTMDETMVRAKIARGSDRVAELRLRIQDA